MSKLIKLVACVVFASLCGSIFAYNGGYENSIVGSTTVDGKTYAGYGNNTLTAREESGTTIPANKYAQCKKLTSVNLANVTAINNAAFAYSALTSVAIPSTVSSMGYIAFGGCENLTQVTVSNFNWYDEKREPFRDCPKLRSLVANCEPPSMNAAAFKELFPNLTSVRVPAAQMAAWTNKKYSGITVKDAAADTYTIRYHEGCGDRRFVETDYKRGATVALSSLGNLGWSNAGHVFLGWAKSEDATIPVYVNCEKVSDLAAKGKAIDLYAVWASSSDVYRIKFEKNDGTGATYTFAYEMNVERSITQIGHLGWSWSGKTFLGWAKSAAAKTPVYVNGEKIKDLTTAGKTITLYAVWANSSNVYRIKFEKNDGTGATYTFAYEKSVERSITQIGHLGWSWSGKTFLGWAKSAAATVPVYVNGEKITDLAAVGKTITLYAVWANSSNVYRIKFEKNDGTGVSYTFAYERNVARKLTFIGHLGWSRSGYSFNGWSTSSSAVTPIYTNGQEVNNLKAAGQTLTLYAVWKKISSAMVQYPKATVISSAAASSADRDSSAAPAYDYFCGSFGDGYFELFVYPDDAMFVIHEESGIDLSRAFVTMAGEEIIIVDEYGKVYFVSRENGAYIAVSEY